MANQPGSEPSTKQDNIGFGNMVGNEGMTIGGPQQEQSTPANLSVSYDPLSSNRLWQDSSPSLRRALLNLSQPVERPATFDPARHRYREGEMTSTVVTDSQRVKVNKDNTRKPSEEKEGGYTASFYKSPLGMKLGERVEESESEKSLTKPRVKGADVSGIGIDTSSRYHANKQLLKLASNDNPRSSADQIVRNAVTASFPGHVLFSHGNSSDAGSANDTGYVGRAESVVCVNTTDKVTSYRPQSTNDQLIDSSLILKTASSRPDYADEQERVLLDHTFNEEDQAVCFIRFLYESSESEASYSQVYHATRGRVPALIAGLNGSTLKDFRVFCDAMATTKRAPQAQAQSREVEATQNLKKRKKRVVEGDSGDEKPRPKIAKKQSQPRISNLRARKEVLAAASRTEEREEGSEDSNYEEDESDAPPSKSKGRQRVAKSKKSKQSTQKLVYIDQATRDEEVVDSNNVPECTDCRISKHGRCSGKKYGKDCQRCQELGKKCVLEPLLGTVGSRAKPGKGGKGTYGNPTHKMVLASLYAPRFDES